MSKQTKAQISGHVWHQIRAPETGEPILALNLKAAAQKGSLHLSVEDLIALLRFLDQPIRVPALADLVDPCDTPAIVEFTFGNDMPALTWVEPDGTKKAAVYVDYLAGEFQFLAYGSPQLNSAAEGYVSIKCDQNGNISCSNRGHR